MAAKADTYQFTIEEVEKSQHPKITNFWKPGEDRSKTYAEESMKYHYFWEAVESSGMDKFIEEYGHKGLVVTMKRNEHGAYFPSEVSVSDSLPLTFEQIFIIENEKDIPNRNFEYEYIYGEQLAFLAKCAEIYAKRYHSKMMADLKNVDLFI